LPPADIVNVIRRIKLLGFTAVRLPFSMQNLINDTARDFQWTACQNIAQSDIIASVTNPAVGIPKGVNIWSPCWFADAYSCLRWAPVLLLPQLRTVAGAIEQDLRSNCSQDLRERWTEVSSALSGPSGR